MNKDWEALSMHWEAKAKQFAVERDKWRTGADNMAQLFEDAKRRIAELEAQLLEARQRVVENETWLAEEKRLSGELEARLAAIDDALDDANAPESTEAHALDNDPIIERIKLWKWAQVVLVEQGEARLAEAEAAKRPQKVK